MNRRTLTTLLYLVMVFVAPSVYSQSTTTLDLVQCRAWYADNDFQRIIVWIDSVSVANKSILMADGKAVHLYGAALQAVGAHDKAIGLYRERLLVDSTDTDCAHDLGQCLNTMGRYKESVTVLEKAWALNTKNLNILRTLAQVLFNDKQFDRARSYYALLIDKGARNPFYYAQIARCYANSEDETLQKNAIEYYVLVAYELAPTNRAVVLESAEYLRGAKSPYHALAVLNKAVLTFPADAIFHAECGKNLLLQNRFVEAKTAFLQALALGDSSRATLRELGISYYMNRSFDTARFYLEAALLTNIAKPDARTLAFLGVVYREQKQFDKAQIMFSNALKIHKANELADIIVQQGLTHKRAGQNDSAFAKYVMAQKLDPEDTDVLYEMGTLLETNPTQRTAAIQCFVAYLERTRAQSSQAAQYARQRLKEWGYNTHSIRQNTGATETLSSLASVLGGASSATINGTTSTVPQVIDGIEDTSFATNATLRLLPQDMPRTTTNATIPKNK